jgi:hypothetical protein
MNRRRRDELVEARADLILADELAAAAYADHFEAQMRPGKVCVLRRAGHVLLAILAFLFGGLHEGGEARGRKPSLRRRSGTQIRLNPDIMIAIG